MLIGNSQYLVFRSHSFIFRWSIPSPFIWLLPLVSLQMRINLDRANKNLLHPTSQSQLSGESPLRLLLTSSHIKFSCISRSPVWSNKPVAAFNFNFKESLATCLAKFNATLYCYLASGMLLRCLIDMWLRQGRPNQTKNKAKLGSIYSTSTPMTRVRIPVKSMP